MIQKIKSKKGFTLAELLIVIAIIGVLIAIAIPVFGSQLTKANTAVDDANKRSAQSMATVEYLLAGDPKPTTLYAVVDAKHNMTIATSAPATGTYYTVTLDAAT
ncbi:MAG: prepilin-type N-terminal cleavage/methylation domain-containing protein, partial [Oscillospiraceae bacterium]